MVLQICEHTDSMTADYGLQSTLLARLHADLYYVSRGVSFNCGGAGTVPSPTVGQSGSKAARGSAATSKAPAARRPEYNPVAVTLEGLLHRFVRPESLGALNRWICTRHALHGWHQICCQGLGLSSVEKANGIALVVSDSSVKASARHEPAFSVACLSCFGVSRIKLCLARAPKRP